MKTIEAAQHVVKNGCCLIRPRKNTPHEWDVKPSGGNKRGWFYMDAMTATMLVAIYNALGDENRKNFNRIPLMRLIDFGWTHVKVA